MSMHPWLLVSGDFTPLGGMDRANHAFARHLAGRSSTEVHVVAHRISPDLMSSPRVFAHRVPRPLGWHVAGGPLLAATGRRWAGRLRSRRVRVLVNGGNCAVGGTNWVHYLHAAYTPAAAGHAGRRMKSALAHHHHVAGERAALQEARIVICNSRRTKQDVVERIGIAEERVHVVYYGSDPIHFAPVGGMQRMAAKLALGFPVDRPLVGFIGALGD